MTLEQAKELEANRWMLVEDELLDGKVKMDATRYKNLVNAVRAWGESLADLRSHQSVEERTAAASEATLRYVDGKRGT